MLTIKLNKEKATKNYVRYLVVSEGENGPALGAIYIKQSALPQPWPEALVLKAEPATQE